MARWMPRLANDPFYNRNLSLTVHYTPEYVAPTDWNTDFHDRPRIMGVPLTGGAGEYRLRAPLRVIGLAGLAQTMIVEPPRPEIANDRSSIPHHHRRRPPQCPES